MTKIDAKLSWGHGASDIMIDSDCGIVLSDSGTSYNNKVQIDLSLDDAKSLVAKLTMSIHEVEKMNQICKDHDEWYEKEFKNNRISNLKGRLKDLENALPYADGPAYYEDVQEIRKIKAEILELESESERMETY